MDNHVHLVLGGKLSELSEALRRINTKFAMGFNTQKDRIGHVFQGRFKSEPILDERHLLTVLRYIHNNPVKAGMIDNPDKYIWSSFQDYMKPSSLLDHELREIVLAHFGGNTKSFELFHTEHDSGEYLDIKEDQENYRQERALNIISLFLSNVQKSNISDIEYNSQDMDDLIIELIRNVRLPYRKVSELLKIPYSRVFKAVTESKIKRASPF
jgi:putative transposase